MLARTPRITTIRENLALGFSLVSSGFVAATLGAEFPLVIMLFVWGGVVITFAVKAHMDLLESQRREEFSYTSSPV